jgi:hypothetical protein
MLNLLYGIPGSLDIRTFEEFLKLIKLEGLEKLYSTIKHLSI